MKIDGLDVGAIFDKFAVQQKQGIQGVQKPEPSAAKGSSFSDMLSNAVKEVDGLQKQADQEVQGLTLGEEGYTTHGAMMALEKADAAFQLMNNIRAKIIRAYEEVIRTQV